MSSCYSRFSACATAASLIVVLALSSGVSGAAEQDATSLAKAAQNPIADMISLPFQYNASAIGS